MANASFNGDPVGGLLERREQIIVLHKSHFTFCKQMPGLPFPSWPINLHVMKTTSSERETNYAAGED